VGVLGDGDVVHGQDVHAVPDEFDSVVPPHRARLDGAQVGAGAGCSRRRSR
jgi:hypothetical protein